MNRIGFRLGAIFVLLMFPACAVLEPNKRSVLIGPRVFFILQPPDRGPEFNALQKVSISSQSGQHEDFLVAVENDRVSFRLALFDSFGQTLLTLRLDDADIATSVRVPLGPNLDPRRILGLIQLSLWPVDALRQGLGEGERLLEKSSRREIWKYDKVILQIETEGKQVPFRKILIESPVEGWRLDITTLEE